MYCRDGVNSPFPCKGPFPSCLSLLRCSEYNWSVTFPSTQLGIMVVSMVEIELVAAGIMINLADTENRDREREKKEKPSCLRPHTET